LGLHAITPHSHLYMSVITRASSLRESHHQSPLLSRNHICSQPFVPQTHLQGNSYCLRSTPHMLIDTQQRQPSCTTPSHIAPAATKPYSNPPTNATPSLVPLSRCTHQMSAERKIRSREPPPRQNLSDGDRLRLLTEMR
jgi:hypothetical protein